MKRLLYLFCLILLSNLSFAQLNMTLVGQLTYTSNSSDIWGYVDSNGDEYALVGLADGVSVVDISDPANPVQVSFHPGATSIWRDIKTWGNYAYVTTDQGTDGLMIIDLSNLPTSTTATLWQPTLTVPSGSGTLERAHNIWIDENGVAYISGHNIGNRGVMFLDVATTPGTPIYLGAEDAAYSHDCYTRGDTLFSADINAGYLSVWDVSNKAQPTLYGTVNTPFNFTHNVWLSDDSKTAFTTDEVANAWVAAYDVSDPSNMIELDRYRPNATAGTGVIPHNVHVWNDYLIISYYSDGCILVDAARPDNLIEVGNFDTYIQNGQGFNGSWGAYPYFPSGLVIVSDIQTGLYVLQPNYVRACYLEGNVTDSASGLALNNVNVEILTTLENDQTDISGEYKTGIATAGTYDVKFSLAGYQTKTVSVNLSNGQLTNLNVQLVALNAFALNGTVTDLNSGATIGNAQVNIKNEDFDFNTITNNVGAFIIPTFFAGDYDVTVGKWGYKTKFNAQNINQNSGTLNVTLEEGYQDEFEIDLGWSITSTASTGAWERGVPEATTFQGNTAQIGYDVSNDNGTQCYITGLTGGGAGTNDVDNGDTRLTSPVFDLTNYSDPYLTFQTYFFNDGGQGNPDDALTVRISNGLTQTTLLTIDQTSTDWSAPWMIKIDSFITPTANMRVLFETSDLQGSGHLVEAGVDFFTIFDSIQVNTLPVDVQVTVNTFPNPSFDEFTMNYDLSNVQGEVSLVVYNNLGQAVHTELLNNKKGNIQFGDKLSAGVYHLTLLSGEQQLYSEKVIKQ